MDKVLSFLPFQYADPILRFAVHRSLTFQLTLPDAPYLSFISYPGLRRSSLPGVIDIIPFQGI